MTIRDKLKEAYKVIEGALADDAGSDSNYDPSPDQTSLIKVDTDKISSILS